jgi:hypothetical protein
LPWATSLGSDERGRKVLTCVEVATSIGEENARHVGFSAV